MPTKVNYSWRIYGASSQNPDADDCEMVAYYNDPTHVPTQWDEILTGKEKLDAIAVVLTDKAAAEQIPDGKGYTQWTINGPLRWYGRTSKETGNTWEVVLDEYGNELPNPCVKPSPPQGDPRNRQFNFINGAGTLTYQGQQATLTMKWTELPPAA